MPRTKSVSAAQKGSPLPSEKKGMKRYALAAGVFLVVIIAIAAVLYFYLQYTNTKMLLAGVNGKPKEVQELVSAVGKHMDLPQDEVPTLATVSDITKLADQSFFARAKNGDRLLIYTQAKKAILYRPDIDKIIEVGPVNTQEAEQRVAREVVSRPVKVALYNGTSTVGLTRRVEASLQELSSLKAEVVAKENASKDTYTASVVVDLTGKNGVVAKQLAEFAKASVGDLPEGESKPSDADILIVLGKSYVDENSNSVSPTE